MKKFVTYVLWNLCISGTLALGYFMDAMKPAGIIIGVLYVLILPTMVLGAIALHVGHLIDDEGTAKGISKLRNSAKLRPYHILEPVFPMMAWVMGYRGISFCMIIEIFLMLYIVAVASSKKKEDDA